MLADGPLYDLHEHLGEHPLPLLRPLLHGQILRAIGAQNGEPLFTQAADLLDQRWQDWVEANAPRLLAPHLKSPEKEGQRFDGLRTLNFQINGQTISGQVILDAMAPAVEAILLTLSDLQPQTFASTWTPQWQPEEDSPQLVGLYRTFVEFAEEVASKTIDTIKRAHAVREGPSIPNTALLALLQQFQAETAAEGRDSSGDIDRLVELLLIENWSEEGGGKAGMGGG